MSESIAVLQQVLKMHY